MSFQTIENQKGKVQILRPKKRTNNKHLSKLANGEEQNKRGGSWPEGAQATMDPYTP